MKGQGREESRKWLRRAFPALSDTFSEKSRGRLYLIRGYDML
jgi:hypothetical protein